MRARGTQIMGREKEEGDRGEDVGRQKRVEGRGRTTEKREKEE